MKRTDELREMLDKLKAESGSSGQAVFSENIRAERPAADRMPLRREFQELKNQSLRPERQNVQKFNAGWSENKEALLFGMLVSAVVSALGVLGRQEILVLAGAAAFLFFCLLSFMAFFRYISAASSEAKIPEEILERLASLERRAETLPRAASASAGSAEERLSEMEQKLEELKLIVKTIAQKRG